MAIGFQLILRRTDDAVLAPGVEARRAFSAAVGRLGQGSLLVAFHAPDGHAHLPVLGSRAGAGRLARRLLVSLGRVLGHAGHFEPARLRPIHDQRHLRNLFRYTLDQERHHGVEVDPYHEASALPDLLGLRVTGAWMQQVVAEQLPRVRREHLVEMLGFDPGEPGDLELCCLADAVGAAIARPNVCGGDRLRVAARTAAVRLGRSHFDSNELAAALGITPRTVQRLARCEVSLTVQRAVLGQWRLRSSVRGATELG